jgi:uncharacterized protein YkwD
MTSRERSILVGGAALLCALLAVFIGARTMMGGESADSLDGSQYVQNAPDGALPTTTSPSAVAQTGRVIVPGVESSLPGSSSTALDEASTSLAPPTVAETSSTEAPTSTEASTSTTVEETTTTTAPSSSTTTATVSTTTTAPLSGHHAIELEIHRLTNELRANPSGPLARQKPMPSCVSDSFYGINIDQATGHPTAVPALGLNEAVSINLARDWSMTMDATGNFDHRPNSEAIAIYSQLGIGWRAIGENIAWFSGYTDAQAARVFFDGWRESDLGHYCALVAPVYSNVGVGYHKGASRSWATQNFYGS